MIPERIQQDEAVDGYRRDVVYVAMREMMVLLRECADEAIPHPDVELRMSCIRARANDELVQFQEYLGVPHGRRMIYGVWE